jgi:DNA-binding MarR family transcriptional regulator
VPGTAVSSQPLAADPDAGTAERLRAVVARLVRRSAPTRAGAALTPAAASVLAGAIHRGPIRLSELANAEGMNPTMLSRLVNDLERAGLVTRQVDPSDRRAALVEATAAGERLHGQIRAERGRIFSLALTRLSAPEREAITDGLGALEALADQLGQPAGLGPAGLGPAGLGPAGLGPAGLGPAGHRLAALRSTRNLRAWRP